jgi:hypothetical protein
MEKIDLGIKNRDYAVFLPSISSFYNTYIAKQLKGKFIPDERLPKGFDEGVAGMNFLDQQKGYFYYPYALYSAGHAQLDLNKTLDHDAMVHSRDRANSIILGDSGGYQIGKGVLKFDWQDFKGASANATRKKILEWLELTADWSMMLDVPTWACDKNHSPKTGLKTFDDCLEATKFNNEYFLDNRVGQTKFLNVLQGTDWETAEKWYSAVKDYKTEGWAFGAINMCEMDTTLKRIIILRDEGKLHDRDWIHFLGTSQLDWACFLTAIQRQLRKHVNPKITVSFDCASPFISTAHGLVYTHNQFKNDRFSYIMDKAFDNKSFKNSDMPFPHKSPITDRMTIGDICYYGPGDLNKIGKEGKTSWDSFSYALMMCHNVYNHIEAVQVANAMKDVEAVNHKPDWRAWRKTKASDKSDEYSEFVPRNILYFETFVEELFESKEPMALIDEAKGFLADIRGVRLRGGPVKNTFGALFEEEKTFANDSTEFDPDDDKMNDLIEKVKETVNG